jgi:hypothetical protein
MRLKFMAMLVLGIMAVGSARASAASGIVTGFLQTCGGVSFLTVDRVGNVEFLTRQDFTRHPHSGKVLGFRSHSCR